MKQSSALRKTWNIFHTLIIYVGTILATIVFGTTAIAVSFFSKNGDSVHHVAQIWGKTILLVSGIRVDSRGLEQLEDNCPYIFMSNHQSNFDIPVLLSGLPAQFRWLAKAELFKIPLFGSSMRGAGYISIDRSNRKSAFESLRQAAIMIRNGASVLIFPEGTRSSDGVLLPFKKGGFVLAVDAGVPIVPIVISGTQRIMPKGRLLIHSQRVSINIQKPIQASEYTRKTKDELMVKVRDAMIDRPAVPAEGGGGG